MKRHHGNVLGIDHLAIAAPDLAAAVEWARSTLGFEVDEFRETMGAKSGMKSAVLRLGPVTFVFMEGIGDQSQITRFVREHGAGVQHVALRVENLGRAIEEIAGGNNTFSTPRLDGEGLSQIFGHRDPSTGLMVEFIERRNFDGFRDENVHRLFDSLEKQDLV